MVSAFLVVAAVPDDTEVVETVVADVAHDDAEVADIVDDDTEVVAEVVVEVVGVAVVSAVQNLLACKTHPGSAMVATAAD